MTTTAIVETAPIDLSGLKKTQVRAELRALRRERDRDRLIDGLTTLTGQGVEVIKSGAEILKAGMDHDATRAVSAMMVIIIARRARLIDKNSASVLLGAVSGISVIDALTPW